MKMVDKDAREAHYTPCRKSELAGISLHFTLMDKNFSVQNYLFHSYKYHFRLKMCRLKGVGDFIFVSGPGPTRLIHQGCSSVIESFLFVPEIPLGGTGGDSVVGDAS